LEIATETLCIPMLGEMESLNVSISAAILAYTISEK
jgi:tRNA G18 (ribose-2'-O)-methylase SpoU